MKNILHHVIYACLTAVGLLQFTGCSLVGFTIGAGVDWLAPDRDTISVPGASAYDHGQTITVHPFDGSPVTGEFQSIEKLSATEYAERYTTMRAQLGKDSELVPEIGATLTFVRRYVSTSPVTGIFCGFDYGDRMEFKTPDSGKPFLFVANSLKDVRDGSGKSFDLNDALDLLHRGRLPFFSSVKIFQWGDTIQIPLDQVMYFEDKKPHKAKWIGLAAGMVIDILIAIHDIK